MRVKLLDGSLYVIVSVSDILYLDNWDLVDINNISSVYHCGSIPLNKYSLGPLLWQSEVAQVNDIKNKINDLLARVFELEKQFNAS